MGQQGAAGDRGSGYFHSEDVEGTRHFGIWPLTQAAQACFGEDHWPEHLATPQVTIEGAIVGVSFAPSLH